MIATMAPKKPNKSSQSAGSRPGKASLQVWLPASLIDSLDTYVEESRPETTRTAVLKMLLEDFLKERGQIQSE